MSDSGEIKIWDLPIRILHWLLVLGVAAAWWTADNGHMQIHTLIGKTILVLIAFRLLWGLYGSETARFSGFLKGPRAVAAHFRALASRSYRPQAGHNPAGGWMVIALLAALTIQAGMGLFGKDDIGLFYGPLAGFVSDSMSERIAGWHHDWFNAILVLVALHILAVILYAAIKREPLIRPMITGIKRVEARPPQLASPWLALLIFAIAFGLVWGAITLLNTLAMGF